MVSLERLVFFCVLSASTGCLDYTLRSRLSKSEGIHDEGSTHSFETDTAFDNTVCTYTQTYIVPSTEDTTYDILMVVDTSGSMGSGESTDVYEWYEHSLLPSLPKYADWKLKVISANPNFAVADTAVPFSRTSTTTDWFISPTEVEKPFEAILSYMNAGNASWMRSSAPLEFIIFSDEDDQSFLDSEGSRDLDDFAVSLFIGSLYSLKDENLVYISSIIATESSACTGSIGYRIINLTDRHEGYLNTICADSETWNAEALNLEEPGGAYQPVELLYYPHEETIVLYVNDTFVNKDYWTYNSDERSIDYVYGENLFGNSVFTITYEVDKNEYSNQCPFE